MAKELIFTEQEIKVIKMLKELRVHGAGLTFRGLGAVLGVSSPCLCMIERFKKKPSLNILKAYHKFFNIPLETLMGIDDSEKNKEIYDLKDHCIENLKNKIKENIAFLNNMLIELEK